LVLILAWIGENLVARRFAVVFPATLATLFRQEIIDCDCDCNIGNQSGPRKTALSKVRTTTSLTQADPAAIEIPPKLQAISIVKLIYSLEPNDSAEENEKR